MFSWLFAICSNCKFLKTFCSPCFILKGDVQHVSWLDAVFRCIQQFQHASITSISNKIFGWWFGTFFFCPYIGNSNPNWLSHFSEGLKPPDMVFQVVFRSNCQAPWWSPTCWRFTGPGHWSQYPDRQGRLSTGCFWVFFFGTGWRQDKTSFFF